MATERGTWTAGDEIVVRAGLSRLPAPVRRELAASVLGWLESAVGKEISAGLTDAQLREFDEVQSAGDEVAVGEWLDAAMPSHGAIARGYVEAFVAALRRRAGRFRAEFGPAEGGPGDDEDDETAAAGATAATGGR